MNIIVLTEAYEDYLKDSRWLKTNIIPAVNMNNDLMLKGERKPNYKRALKYLRKVIKYLPKEIKVELKEQENER